MTIEEMIRQRLQETNTVAAQSVDLEVGQKGTNNFLTHMVIVISIITFGVFAYDYLLPEVKAKLAAKSKPTNDIIMPYIEPEPEAEPQMMSVPQRNLAAELDALKDTVHTWATRTWMLGVANNENFNLLKRVQSRQCLQDPGYIIFDEKWKMNRTPQTVILKNTSDVQN